METILQSIPYLLIAGLIGFFIGMSSARRRTREAWAKEKERLESKIRSYERDLDKARGESKTFREQAVSVKNELTASTGKLQSRDAEFGAMEAKLSTLERFVPELELRNSELSALKVEIDVLRSSLAEAETAAQTVASRPVEQDPNLLAEVNMLRHQLSSKENEIALLLTRVKELAPLGLQIKDRDLRLREWESKHAEILRTKDGEIAKLHHRVNDLETSSFSIATHEARVGEISAKHEATLNEKEAQVVNLQLRLDAANIKIAERDTKLRELEMSWRETAGEKDAEIARLQMRIDKLEASGIQPGRSEPELHESVISEPELRELEARHQATD